MTHGVTQLGTTAPPGTGDGPWGGVCATAGCPHGKERQSLSLGLSVRPNQPNHPSRCIDKVISKKFVRSHAFGTPLTPSL